MTLRPRLIVSDLDGTFLDPMGQVTAINRDAVVDAVDAGIGVLLATGRPPRWLGVIEDLPVGHPLVISSNGALLWDLQERRPLISHPVDAVVAQDAMAAIRDELPEVTFGVEIGMRFGHEPGWDWFEEAPVGDAFFTATGADLVAEPFVKFLVQHVGLPSEPLAATVEQIVGDALTVTHSNFHSSTGLLEISAPGVSKATLLQEWCIEQGIDAADVAAFGDMPNDRTMLEWVGQPHIMEQSHPSLHSVVGSSGRPAVRIGSNAASAVGARIREWL